jgi:hypothetical protein
MRSHLQRNSPILAEKRASVKHATGGRCDSAIANSSSVEVERLLTRTESAPTVICIALK